jgi:hypothetical protein
LNGDAHQRLANLIDDYPGDRGMLPQGHDDFTPRILTRQRKRLGRTARPPPAECALGVSRFHGRNGEAAERQLAEHEEAVCSRQDGHGFDRAGEGGMRGGSRPVPPIPTSTIAPDTGRPAVSTTRPTIRPVAATADRVLDCA